MEAYLGTAVAWEGLVDLINVGGHRLKAIIETIKPFLLDLLKGLLGLLGSFTSSLKLWKKDAQKPWDHRNYIIKSTRNVLWTASLPFSRSLSSQSVSLSSHLTVTGLLELVPDTLEFLHGLHVGCADPLKDTLLLVQTLLQRVRLRLDLFLWQYIL